TLNGRTLSRRTADAAYQLVGGDGAPRPFRDVPMHSTVTRGDGLVDAQSATGRSTLPAWPSFWSASHLQLIGSGNGATVERHSTDASHRSPQLWWDPIASWYPSYFNETGPDDTAPTGTYQCLQELLGLASSGCQDPPELIPPGTDQPSSANLLETEELADGQVLAYPFVLDTPGLAQIDLTWVTGTLGITLTSPTGQIIDPVYAVSHPDQMAYVGPGMVGGSGLVASYYLTSTVRGAYTATVRAAAVPGGGTAFTLAGSVHSPLAIAVGTDRPVYPTGATAVISAGLSLGDLGIAGAQVAGYVTKPDGSEQEVLMVDLGGGVYSGVLVVPDEGGRLPVRVEATGEHDGASFARVALAWLWVQPKSVALTGEFSDAASDPDWNGLFETLDVTIGITGTAAGPFWVAADLYDASGFFVAHSAGWADLGDGGGSVTIRFDGDAIRASGGDGPYSLRNVTVADSRDGHTPVLLATGEQWVSGYWPASDFGATCYLVETRALPPGSGTVLTAPAARCNDGLQHPDGTEVTLTASAAAGYRFIGWEGDLSGSDITGSVSVGPDKSVVARFELVATLTPPTTPTTLSSSTPLASATPDATPTGGGTPATTVTPGTPGSPPPTGTSEPTPTVGPPKPLYVPHVEK
ncbi:MAG: InlB B-repeat-containing protein, partial [Anaerolineae bacterium]